MRTVRRRLQSRCRNRKRDRRLRLWRLRSRERNFRNCLRKNRIRQKPRRRLLNRSRKRRPRRRRADANSPGRILHRGRRLDIRIFLRKKMLLRRKAAQIMTEIPDTKRVRIMRTVRMMEKVRTMRTVRIMGKARTTTADRTMGRTRTMTEIPVMTVCPIMSRKQGVSGTGREAYGMFCERPRKRRAAFRKGSVPVRNIPAGGNWVPVPGWERSWRNASGLRSLLFCRNYR